MTISIFISKEGFSYKNHGCYQTRSEGLMNIFNHAWQYIPKNILPEKPVEFFIYSTDGPIKYTNTAAKTFFMCDAKERAASCCVPDFVLGGWPEAFIPDFDKVMKQITMKGQEPYKYPKLLWIGNTQTHVNRNIIIRLGQQYPNKIHAISMRWRNGLEPSPFISLPDHTQYKYLLDIEGGGYSGRLKTFFWSRRLVFVQDRPLWDYVTAMLEPWVHYVPVKRDMSDLLEKIEWADSNPEKVAEIIQNATRFAEQNITFDVAARHFANLVTEELAKHAIP